MNILAEALNLFQEQYHSRVFLAEVVSVSGNRVTVKRLGKTQPEGPYPAAQGLAATLSAGHRVKCQRVGSVVCVEYRVVI